MSIWTIANRCVRFGVLVACIGAFFAVVLTASPERADAQSANGYWGPGARYYSPYRRRLRGPRVRRRSVRRTRSRSRRARYRNRRARNRNRRSVRRSSVRRRTAARPRSKLLSHRPKDGGPLQIVVSLDRQRISVYADEKKIASSRVSSGQNGYETPTGIFSIIQKKRRHFSNIYHG
ncbi:MAG: L,D-transpeptidase family protein, partial [Hyphomicrobiaceae bacterium]